MEQKPALRILVAAIGLVALLLGLWSFWPARHGERTAPSDRAGSSTQEASVKPSESASSGTESLPAPAGKASASASAQGQSASVSGTVRFTKTGQPAPGIVVEAMRLSSTPDVETSPQATTDEQGRYKIAGILVDPPNTRIVIVVRRELNPYVSSKIPQIRISPGQECSDVDIEIIEGGSISGRVLFETSRLAIANAEVTLRIAGISDQKVFADENGAYHFDELPGTDMAIVSCPGSEQTALGTVLRDVKLAPGEDLTGVDLEFRRACTLSGKVVSAQHQPIQGASLSLSWSAGTAGGHAEVSAEQVSDATGSFAFTRVPPRVRVKLRAVASGCQGLELSADMPDGDLGGLEVVLDKEAIVAGRVVDSLGKPFAGVKVMLQRAVEAPEGQSQYEVPSVKTDSEGKFEIGHVPPGQHFFMLHYGHGGSSEGASFHENPFSIAAGQRLDEFELVMAGVERSIEGGVFDAKGAPVADASVMAQEYGSGRSLASATADKEGHYRVEGLDVGQVSIIASPSYKQQGLHGTARLEPVQVGSKDADVTLPTPGAIAGAVHDARTGDVPAELSVGVESIEATQGGTVDSRAPEYQVDEARGTFYLGGLTPGKATIRVSASGYSTRRMEGLVIADGQVTEVDVPLWPEGRLEGTIVIDAALAPRVRSKSVSLQPVEQGVEGGTPDVVVDDGGRYEAALPAASFIVTAEVALAKQYLSARAQVTIEAGATTRQDFQFGGETGGLAGIVAKPEGYTFAVVCVRDASMTHPLTMEGYRAEVIASVECDDNGAYAIEGLAAGTYNVTGVIRRRADWAPENVRQASQAVVVGAGQVVQVDLAP